MASKRRPFSWVPLPRPAEKRCRGMCPIAAASGRMSARAFWVAGLLSALQIVSTVRLRVSGERFTVRSTAAAAGKD